MSSVLHRIVRAAALAAALSLPSLSASAAPPPAVPAPPARAQALIARPLTILISIDAFRPDYLDRGITPNLSALAESGVRAEMRPSFPSKTFPNHYALVTGKRPDRNGIVDNNMRDAAMPGVKFTMKNSLDERWWDEATPLWVSADRQGIRTASMFWPGSENPIHGLHPDFWRPFDQKVTSAARVDQVLAWLDEPKAKRPNFVTLYFDEVDTAGHHFGPASDEVNRAIGNVDAAIGRLTAGLKARGLTANIVVVADHGMAPISDDRVIWADEILPAAAYDAPTMGAFWSLNPAPGHEAEVAAALLKPHADMQCWRKADIPARFHYGHNPRVPAYLCLPQTGWVVTTHDYVAGRKAPFGGEHGYDNFALEMRAVFIANGPAFRSGERLATFDNVDVYPLVAQIAGIRPEPGDGRLAEVAAALR